MLLVGLVRGQVKSSAVFPRSGVVPCGPWPCRAFEITDLATFTTMSSNQVSETENFNAVLTKYYIVIGPFAAERTI